MTIRRHTPDEMAALFVKEKLLPLYKEIPIVGAEEPEEAASRIAILQKVRLRQFLAEQVERTYRHLLDAARDGPDKDAARATLARAIDENLRWSRNNMAGFGPDCQETPLFARVEQLSLEFQEALWTLDAPEPGASLDTVAEKVDSLHAKADAIQSDTTELKASVPCALEQQAHEIKDKEQQIARLKEALAQRVTNLLHVYRQINAEDMEIFLRYMDEGSQVKVAAALNMKESTLRARVSKWPTRGPAYQRIYEVYRWRKESSRAPGEVPYFENLLVPDQPTPDVDGHMMKDMAEMVRDIRPENAEAKRDELISKYLKEYMTT